MNDASRDSEPLIEMFQQWAAEEGREHNLEAFEQPIGLYQLIEAFTALRHEVKLETKSARQAQAQTEEALKAAQDAILQMRSSHSKQQQALRPLAEALMDQDEALERGHRSVSAMCHRARTEAAIWAESNFDRYRRQQNWLQRLLYRRYHDAATQLAAQYISRYVEELLDGLEEGYDLIRRRLQRSLTQLKIERIPTKGYPFDPQRMTAVETVEVDEGPSGTVAEEVRAGYCFDGRPVRFAEVRVTRRRPDPTAAADAADFDSEDSHFDDPSQG